MHRQLQCTDCSTVCTTDCTAVCTTVCTAVCPTVCTAVCTAVCTTDYSTVCTVVCSTDCTTDCTTDCSTVCSTDCSTDYGTVCSTDCSQPASLLYLPMPRHLWPSHSPLLYYNLLFSYVVQSVLYCTLLYSSVLLYFCSPLYSSLWTLLHWSTAISFTLYMCSTLSNIFIKARMLEKYFVWIYCGVFLVKYSVEEQYSVV